MKNYILIFLSVLIIIKPVGAQNTRKVDSLQNVLKTTTTDSLKIKIQIDLCWEYIKSNPDKAISYTEQAMQLAKKTNNIKGISKCYNNFGAIYTNIGNYPKALEYYIKSLKKLEELSKSPDKNEALLGKRGISACYINIGTLYIYIGNYSKALEYFQKNLKFNEKIGDKKAMSGCYNNIAVVFYYQANYSESLKYYQKSLKIEEELGDKYGLAQGYNNIGIIYNAMCKYVSAIEYYKKCLKISEELGDKERTASVLINIACQNIDLKQYINAIEYSNKSLAIAKEIKSLRLQKANYKNLSDIYDSLRDYKKAFENEKLYEIICDSILNTEKNKQIEEIQTKYETLKKEQEIDILKRDKQIARIRQYVLLIAFAAIAVIFTIIVFWIRNRMKVNKKIAEVEKKIIQTRLKDSENEKKLLSIDLEKKKIEIEYKNQELINLALHIVEKNEFLEKLKTTYANPTKTFKSKELVQTIEQNLNSLEKEKKEFEANIEQVCETFFLKLRKIFPNITKNEERLSALLRLNLSSKEIAMIFNISPQSVDVYRYKLRKKFNLNEEDSLYDFLKKI